MQKKLVRRLVSLAAVLMLLVVAACGSDSGTSEGSEGDSASKEKKGTIEIGLNNWAENVAVSNMWKILLEEKGYEVELTNVEKAALYTGLKGGDLDLGLEVWLPYTDEVFYEDYKEDIAWNDTWYEGTGLGLVVPSYVEIDSIEELNDNKDLFPEQQIVGIDPGASLMQMTDKAIEEYGLEYELTSTSGPIMTAELGNAIKAEEPIVVTLWNPHWAFAEYDLKYLKDPKNVYGDADDILFASRKDFGDDFPEVLECLNNWKMDDDSLGSLMAMIKNEDDPVKGAEKWIEENRDLVDEWMAASE